MYSGRQKQFRTLAREARECERSADFHTASELWLQAKLLSRSPSNRTWAEHRHIFCIYMDSLKKGKDQYGRKLPKYHSNDSVS